MRATAALVTLALLGSVAHADTDYFSHPNDGSTIRMRREKSRTTPQKLVIAGLLVGAAAGIAFGVYYHLDSRDAANEVSANDSLTGETWTPELQATYDRADTSGTVAIVGYVVGALFLGGAVVAAWKTQPGEEQLVVKPTRQATITLRTADAVLRAPAKPRLAITPVRGGAMIGGAWSW